MSREAILGLASRAASPSEPAWRPRTPSPVPRADVRLAKADAMGRAPRPFQLAGAMPAQKAAEIQQAWRSLESSQSRSLQAIRQANAELEENRKQLKRLQGEQSRIQWNVWREERKQQNLAWKSTEDDHRETQQDLVLGMSKIARETARENKLRALQASRDRLDFKRKKKVEAREADVDHDTHKFNVYKEHSGMMKDIAAAHRSRSLDVAEQRRNHLRADRAAHAVNLLQEKAEEHDRRDYLQRSEIEQKMRDVNAEKERILRSMEHSTRCRSKSPVPKAVLELSMAKSQRLLSTPLFSKN